MTYIEGAVDDLIDLSHLHPDEVTSEELPVNAVRFLSQPSGLSIVTKQLDVAPLREVLDEFAENRIVGQLAHVLFTFIIPVASALRSVEVDVGLEHWQTFE